MNGPKDPLVSRRDDRPAESITHNGINYLTTHFAQHSETPLETCPGCAGTGQLYSRKCSDCHSRGLIVTRSKGSVVEKE